MRIVAKFSAGIEARRATGDLRPGSGESGNGCPSRIRRQDSG